MGYDSCINAYSKRKAKSKRNILTEILNGLFFIPLLLICIENFSFNNMTIPIMLNALIVCVCAACIRSVNNITELICLLYKAYEKYNDKTVLKAKKIIVELVNGVFIVPIFLVCGTIWSWKGFAICILAALIRNVDDIANLFTKK